MLGLMQDHPLLISQMIEHAALNHADTEIVSRSVEGPIHRYTYKECAVRCRKLASALTKLGTEQGDTVGTLAWPGMATATSNSISVWLRWVLFAIRLIPDLLQNNSFILLTMPKINSFLRI